MDNKNKKALGYGVVSAATTIVFILAVILLNVFASKLETRINTKIDLTNDAVFEITDETKNFLATLDKDVQITVFMDKQTLNDLGSEGKSIVEVLSKYEQSSPHISTVYANAETNPEIYTRFSNMYKGDLTSYIAVVTCGDKIRPLSQNDLISYSIDQMSGAVTAANSTEQAVTSAIMNVINTTTHKITILKTDSYSYIATLTEALQANGYEVETVDAITGEIDPASSMVILNTPTVDIYESTAKKLSDYLNNGGNLGKNVLYISSYQQSEMQNINGLLSEYGLKTSTGRILDLNTANMYTTGNVYSIVTTTLHEDFLSGIQDKNLPVFVPTPGEIEVLWDSRDLRETKVLLGTEDTAVSIPHDADLTTLDLNTLTQKSYPLIAMGSKHSSLNALDRVSSNIIVMSAPDICDTMYFSSVATNNADYLLSIINTVNGKEQAITITPKSLSTDMLEASDSQTRGMMVFAVIIIPLAISIAGVVVYIRRRHK